MSAEPVADTIAAVATPPGVGGVGIVRISGPNVPTIARTLLGRLPAARHATFARFQNVDGNTLDEGLALYFPAPRSYTGEHVLELHGHGGPVVLDLVMQAVLAQGARPARPGEFSERAFLNGKLDLIQAEAVADLIESASAEAARAALRSLQGAFSQRVQAINEQLIGLRLHIEAALDFPEEEIDFLADEKLSRRAQQLTDQIDALRATTHQGQLLHDGITVVLAGRPNAGKSSLLNALTQHDSAIVSPVPGTTRDVLRERVQIDGLPLHVLDTAGLRESSDAIESEGVRRTHEAMRRANRVLLVIDDSETDREITARLYQGDRDMRIRQEIMLGAGGIRMLRALFNFGKKKKLITENPVDGIDFIPVEHKTKYVPPAEDIDKVISVADRDTQDYLLTIRDTMGRMGEINRLTWDDVNFNHRYVILYTRKKKGGNLTPRKIPMTKRIYEILLRRYKNRDESKPWVFWHTYTSSKAGKKKTGPYKNRQKIMRTLCEKAGVQYFRFHALRHSGASIMDNNHVPIGSIQRILGHENRSTTEIYLHSIEFAERNAISIFEKALKKSHTDSHTEKKEVNP